MRVWLRVSGADRQAGRRCSQPQEPHLLRLCHTCVILDDDGRVSEVYAAHDSGKVVNPISIQGQIEGGVLMGMGYALTEDWPLKDCVPQARYGTLGLFRAPEIPDIHAIYVEKDELLPVAYGGKGIGEIATIPTAPAVQNAYRAFDGKLRPDLPWWIRRTAAPVTAGRVERGRPLLTAVCACHQLYKLRLWPQLHREPGPFA